MNEAKVIAAALGVEPLRACNCIGPQDGQPLCPCAMRGVQVINGRYVKVQDPGPAPAPDDVLAKRFEAGGPLIDQNWS